MRRAPRMPVSPQRSPSLRDCMDLVRIIGSQAGRVPAVAFQRGRQLRRGAFMVKVFAACSRRRGTDHDSEPLSPLPGPSQSFKPRQDGCIRSPQRHSTVRSMVDRLRLFDGLSLHLKVYGGVAVGRGDTGVAKPLTYRDESTPARSRCTAVLWLPRPARPGTPPRHGLLSCAMPVLP
jgi:hypothetical protein